MIRKIFFSIIVFAVFATIVKAEATDMQLKAEVLDITHISVDGEEIQLVNVNILENPYYNEIISIQYSPAMYSRHNFDLQPGQKIIIDIFINDNGEYSAYIVNISRFDYLKLLGILFIIMVILFGRLKGMLSVISLGVSGLILLKILIPMILNGYSPVTAAIFCSSLIIVISFVLISGFTKKSLSAILGTISGTIIAGILAQYFIKITSITGTADEEVLIMITEMGIDVDFRGLLMGGILIGTIGVIMDVSMSITSFIFELKEKSPKTGFLGLFSSGLKVGRDVMATMTNTLILAYVGTSIPLFLMFTNSRINLKQAVNTEVISTEIIRSLCGSVGLILTIPLTALVASFMARSIISPRHMRKRMYI